MIEIAAVLTGDIIASTAAGHVAVDRSMAIIENIAMSESGQSGKDLRFARFRGDGWQIYCSRGQEVHSLAVRILAELCRHPNLPQTRISAAIGRVNHLPATGLASAIGPVFTQSGQELDSMGPKDRLRFTTQDQTTYWQIAIFSYLDWQSSRWSPEQAEAISLSFQTPRLSIQAIGEKLGITRQAVQARLSGAGYAPLVEASAAFNFYQPDGPPHD